MKAIELTAAKLDAFRATTIATLEPQRGEVLIRQRAASLNFVDVAVASGNYRVPGFPLIPVADGAGDIVAPGGGRYGFRRRRSRRCPCQAALDRRSAPA
ncbi:hypothetical protein NKJ64_19400 [Mesorhizobium sp. M0062]|uniref:alcohol dehydrogenase catalytic domain-containing protein n=1 Tax=Mesorhizobium sp. M0062 TaxID=2956867 RepID=UPI00333918B5